MERNFPKAKITKNSLNPYGIAHGGFIFGLGDTVLGMAASATGRPAVTLNSTINYLRPAKSEYIIAKAELIKAGKTLLMLDTCNSGAFVADLGQRGLSEKTAIDRLTRATGHATLAASSDTQSAMEGYEGHGVFTYVLLEGLKGEADSNDDGFVTLLELASYVENEVPERSYEKWGYEQVPQKDLRRQDFPIAGK